LIHLFIAATVLRIAMVITYVVTAYEFVPEIWGVVERRHPALDTVGTPAFTSAGIPGDPFNVAFIGSEADLQHAILEAGWYPADPITLKSSMRIAIDSVAHKPYPDAPVSTLFVNGKRQDLAFEQAEGRDPSKRHHVRFWLSPSRDAMNRPLWIAAATFDSGVGPSHTTGQISHQDLCKTNQIKKVRFNGQNHP